MALVMNPLRRAGSRAPIIGLVVALLALLSLHGPALGSDWTSLSRVSDKGGSRLDSLHQLAADRGQLHLAHARVGPNPTDDRVVYQRSSDDGASWTKERTLFSSTNQRRHVVPNLAVAATANVVVVAWRVNGPEENSLLVRVSRDGGNTFGGRETITSTTREPGVGVPAVAVASKGKLVSVAWTNRASGKVKIRTSRDAGRKFGPARTVGKTSLSIDCRKRLTDGLVGLAASERSIHVAWSHSPKSKCRADAIKSRSSTDRGKTWSDQRTITKRRSYGWPELAARGRTVVATVQSSSGGIIMARSGKNGRGWKDRLVKSPKGHSFSAADIALLPDKKAMITYVNELVRNAKLVRTKVVVRWSPDDGGSLRKPKTIVDAAKRLRMAPNIAANGKRAAVVMQSGPLTGTPHNIFTTRPR